VMQWINNGIAVVILIAIGFATWRVIDWSASNIVVPLKDGALRHLDETNKALTKSADATDRLASHLDSMHDDVRDIKNNLHVVCKNNNK